ncbi:hypothetical protein H920_10338 [Fukomys damarensis]|uniref:Uncharacterized protein n=1 Tax=Fukomys damarensis TaxID=885580 RepID=A0A091DBL7_FUKDA|nr:hypothetical protein H920_10338 [Fukomys damarensis]
MKKRDGLGGEEEEEEEEKEEEEDLFTCEKLEGSVQGLKEEISVKELVIPLVEGPKFQFITSSPAFHIPDLPYWAFAFVICT